MNNVDEILSNPNKSIRNLSTTIMLSMIFMFAYNVVDTIFVSHISVDALTAVGFFTPIFMIITAIGQGIGNGMSTAMSRYIGAKNLKEASNTAFHSFIIVILISIIFIILAFFGLKEIMIFIGAGQVIDLAMQYGSINFIFAFVFLIDFLMSSILRSEGAMKRATVIMAIGCILNGVMDPIFIYYLNMGVSGAAVSSVVASFISILIACYWIFIKKDTHVKISLDHFNPNRLLTKEILNVGIPATLEGITMDISTIIINYMLMIVGGSVAVAIFTAGFKIISLSLIPAMGVEFAILTVAGMSFGAGMYEKIKSCYHYSIKFSTLICVIIAVLMFIFSNDLAIIFSQDISLVQGISEFIKILSIGVIGIPIGLCSTAMFQAKGNGIMSLILVLLRDIILGVVFAIIFGFILNMGVFGIFLGISVGYIVAGIISYISFEIYYNRLSKS